jgi:hypothetical protein
VRASRSRAAVPSWAPVRSSVDCSIERTCASRLSAATVASRRAAGMRRTNVAVPRSPSRPICEPATKPPARCVVRTTPSVTVSKRSARAPSATRTVRSTRRPCGAATAGGAAAVERVPTPGATAVVGPAADGARSRCGAASESPESPGAGRVASTPPASLSRPSVLGPPPSPTTASATSAAASVPSAGTRMRGDRRGRLRRGLPAGSANPLATRASSAARAPGSIGAAAARTSAASATSSGSAPGAPASASSSA